MNRLFGLLTLIFMSSWSNPAHAVLRQVTNLGDELHAEGTLRTLLQDACDTSENDEIAFDMVASDSSFIRLQEPLAIPPDCQGKIHLRGKPGAGIVLAPQGLWTESLEAGDACLLNIYSPGNAIENLSFHSYFNGAAICIFGRENEIRSNHFASRTPELISHNRYGVVISDAFAADNPLMDAKKSKVIGNLFAPGHRNAIVAQGTELEISGNEIEGCSEAGILFKRGLSRVFSNTIHDCLGAGILIEAGSSQILIGGDSFAEHRNTIQDNEGGVIVLGDSTSITVTHNAISGNGKKIGDVDLLGDGITANDVSDSDTGPNALFNFTDYLQSFPLLSGSDGKSRYWTWGLSRSAVRAEIYATEDPSPPFGHGGGALWLADALIKDGTLAEILTVDPDQKAWTTVLSFDAAGNTSEYSANFPIGPDQDLDGILDADEKTSSPDNTDSDADGLPDSVEDSNRNGQWDQNLGETSPSIPDSDNDGISDWAETHGDGRYDSNIDSDPLKADSDGDGLLDGQEDKNGNGLIELYLGETSPLSQDSDQDFVLDGKDNCPHIFNAGQEVCN